VATSATTSVPAFARVTPSAIAGEWLEWKRSHGQRRTLELWAKEERVALLRAVGWALREVIAETSGATWMLRRTGFLSRTVRVLEGSGGREIARFQGSIVWGGTLRFVDGREFRWRRLDFWGREKAITRENGEPLLRVRRLWSWIGARGTTWIEASEAREPDLMAMVALGGYLILLQRMRSAR
jgi:hypothetical protein